MKDNFSIQNWRMSILTEGTVTSGESLYIDFHDGSIDEITTDKDTAMLLKKAKQTVQALVDDDNSAFPEANTKLAEHIEPGCYVAQLQSDLETLPTACLVISPKYKDYKTMLDLATANPHDYDLADMVADIVAEAMPDTL